MKIVARQPGGRLLVATGDPSDLDCPGIIIDRGRRRAWPIRLHSALARGYWEPPPPDWHFDPLLSGGFAEVRPGTR
jgi:hypothetical protein